MRMYAKILSNHTQIMKTFCTFAESFHIDRKVLYEFEKDFIKT